MAFHGLLKNLNLGIFIFFFQIDLKNSWKEEKNFSIEVYKFIIRFSNAAIISKLYQLHELINVMSSQWFYPTAIKNRERDTHKKHFRFIFPRKVKTRQQKLTRVKQYNYRKAAVVEKDDVVSPTWERKKFFRTFSLPLRRSRTNRRTRNSSQRQVAGV